MLALSSEDRIFYYSGPVDFRKGFDGLSALVMSELNRDPLDGSLYVFINRRGDKLKVLRWEAGGLSLYYKRLEQGTYERPIVDKLKRDKRLTLAEFHCLLHGISLRKIKYRKRYKKAS